MDDHEEWSALYAEALAADLYPGTHLMADVYEFFAVFSTAYFEVTDELGRGNDREGLENRFPQSLSRSRAHLRRRHIAGGLPDKAVICALPLSSSASEGQQMRVVGQAILSPAADIHCLLHPTPSFGQAPTRGEPGIRTDSQRSL